jgi:hypothetical protein
MADKSDSHSTPAAGGSGPGCWRGLAEVLAIAVIFAAAGSWPVPDVNETVYLTKARHAADPTYAAGDFFLETPDAHGVFYLVMGPLAATVSLDTAAWIGRIAGWLALAIGFRHLVGPLLPGGNGWDTWARLLAAAFFSVGLRYTTAAGEWVIGGCEAKVWAWAVVLGGIGELVRGRFAWAWCLAGGATALHPIVGGWTMLATAATWIAGPRGPARPGFTPTAVLLLVGAAMAAAGVLPALSLSAAADAATRAEAARIYVVERLHHHLLPRTFSPGFIPRHVLAIAVWWLLGRTARATLPRSRLATFTLAAIGISLAGLAVAALEASAPATAYNLLRYYWFRLADVAVPLALACAAAAVLADEAACRRLFASSPWIIRGIATVLVALDFVIQSEHWPLPGRTLAARGDSKVEAAAWADSCDWLRAHAPPGTCVLTPRGAASFTWRTGLPEVVSWKNSPQDAASLVAWRQRITDCFSRTDTIRDMERSTAALGEARLREVAKRYGAGLVIVPLDTPGLPTLPFEQLHANDRYLVLKLTD